MRVIGFKSTRCYDMRTDNDFTPEEVHIYRSMLLNKLGGSNESHKHLTPPEVKSHHCRKLRKNAVVRLG